MKSDICVVIKGAGEMATGVACRLFNSRLKVVLTDIDKPLAVRRAVSFCEAVYDGSKVVEGIEAVLVQGADQIGRAHEQGRIPLVIDPDLKVLDLLKPEVLVEATLSKKDTGLNADLAPLVIALGPGFEVPQNADFVIETNRGHNLGRVYNRGKAEANTGVPGNIAGKTWERVLRAPGDGVFETDCKLGDKVTAGQVVGMVGNLPVKSLLNGVLRGLIRNGTRTHKSLKLGDVDPMGQVEYLYTISEKARAVGGSVLETIMKVYNK